MIITFMGNDGSGKTTTAKEVVKLFRECGFSVRYKHEYEYMVLRYFLRIIGGQNLEKSRKDMLIEKRKSLKFKVWPLLVWADLFLQYLYFKLVKQNEITILDRYPYDHYMSFRYLGTLTRLTEWLFIRFPRPDLSIVLIADPHIAYERKKDTHSYSIEFYESQTKKYIDLARRLDVPIVNTSQEFKQSLSSIVASLLDNERLLRETIRLGIQNRTIVDVITKYDLRIEKLEKISNRYRDRKILFARSLSILKNILADLEIEKYALIKTTDETSFIGNDIDVLLSSSSLDKIRQHLASKKAQHDIKEIHYDSGRDSGKLEIIVNEGLKLDVHSYIGWHNVIFINFEEIDAFIQDGKVHGISCKVVNEKINSVIIAAHIFEKGHMTREEFVFLRKYYEYNILLAYFPKLAEALDNHLDDLQNILRASDHFPVFMPLISFLKDYPKVFNGSKVSGIFPLLRDLLIMIYWRARFAVKRKLPFELNHYYT